MQQALPGFTRETMPNVGFEQAVQAMGRIHQITGQRADQYSEDRSEYDAYIRRAFGRLGLIGK